jgi:hypothetical protein
MTSPGKLFLLLLLLFALAFTAAYYSYPQPQPVNSTQGLSIPASKNFQVEPGLGRNMFGIPLRPEARKLWLEIEDHYKREVREELTSDLGYSYYAGLASVDPDGTPAVKLRNDDRPTEERIVHELYHLKLYADGYPVIRIEYPPRRPTEKQQARIRFLISEVYNTIEHWMFYPEMRKMGLVPDGSVRSTAELILEGDDQEDTPGVTRGDMLALDYFEAALLLDDTQLFARLENQYNVKRWTEALQKGRDMAGIVSSSSPSTPEGAVRTLMRCLEILDRSGNGYELTRWETEKRGSHTLRRIYIKVAPRSKRQ